MDFDYKEMWKQARGESERHARAFVTLRSALEGTTVPAFLAALDAAAAWLRGAPSHVDEADVVGACDEAFHDAYRVARGDAADPLTPEQHHLFCDAGDAARREVLRGYIRRVFGEHGSRHDPVQLLTLLQLGEGGLEKEARAAFQSAPVT